MNVRSQHPGDVDDLPASNDERLAADDGANDGDAADDSTEAENRDDADDRRDAERGGDAEPRDADRRASADGGRYVDPVDPDLRYLLRNGQVLNRSIRILLGSADDKRCDACGRAIAHRTRYKCVTVRDEGGSVRDVSVCGDDCLVSAT
jgi:hypothetical protein